MSGSTLSEFTTFAQSQGSAWLGDAEDVLLDFTRNTFTWPRLIGAHNMKHLVQGGDAIKDRVMLKAQDTWARYDPNESFTYQQGNPGTEIALPWAFGKFDYSWNKQIIGLNINSFTKAARMQKYKSVWHQLVEEAWGNACERMDDELWATPNNNLMESGTPNGPRVPMSIPAYINEESFGLPTALTDANGAAWTTKMTVPVSAGTNTNWVPFQSTYTFDDGADGTPITVAQASSFLRGFSECFRKTQFDRLPKKEQYSDMRTSPNFIGCSNEGVKLVEQALIVSQNRWNSMNASTSDVAYPYPVFKGIAFDYISALDTALLYDSGGANGTPTTEALAAGGQFIGPRFYGINSKYLKMIVHSENFCVPAEVNPSAQPFSHSMIFDVWNNLFGCSMRRHFIFSPSANVPVL